MDSHAELRFLCEPCDPQVQQFWHSLDDDAKEYFDERAAIAEYEAGLSRTEAEAMAMRLTVAYRQRQKLRQPASGSGNGPESCPPL